MFFLQSMREPGWKSKKQSSSDSFWMLNSDQINSATVTRSRLIVSYGLKSLSYSFTFNPIFLEKLCSAVQKQVQNALTNELDFGSLVNCFARINVDNRRHLTIKEKEPPMRVNHAVRHVYCKLLNTNTKRTKNIDHNKQCTLTSS